jgi:hypothetical protein
LEHLTNGRAACRLLKYARQLDVARHEQRGSNRAMKQCGR